MAAEHRDQYELDGGDHPRIWQELLGVCEVVCELEEAYELDELGHAHQPEQPVGARRVDAPRLRRVAHVAVGVVRVEEAEEEVERKRRDHVEKKGPL